MKSIDDFHAFLLKRVMEHEETFDPGKMMAYLSIFYFTL